MIKTLLLFGLFSANLFLQSCKSSATDDLKIQNKQSNIQNQSGNFANTDNTATTVEKSQANSQTVNFKGVSFNYNPQVFDKAEPEDVIEDSPLQCFTKNFEK